MRTQPRRAALVAAVSLGLMAALTILPGTAQMASLTRTYFDNPEYTCTYDYDDVALKLTAVHCDNRLQDPLTFQIVRSSDDVVLREITAPVGHSDRQLTGAQQANIILDGRGRISNIYARTT